MYRCHITSSLVVFCVLCVQDGWTALMSAAYSGHMKVVELLLEKGAKTCAINNVSESLLLLPPLFPETITLIDSTCMDDEMRSSEMIWL